MATYLLKAPDGEMAVWKAAAREAGAPFSEWLRDAAREKAQPVAGLAEAVADTSRGFRGGAELSMDASSSLRPGKSRTTMCVHRRPPDRFCPRCDA